MKKLNGFEKHLIEEGLKLVAQQMKMEIAKAESSNRTPLFTNGFVDLTIDEALSKLETLTLKRAF
jgi:hypothetical protein